MVDNIPPIIGAIIGGTLALVALYRCYILPGYSQDKRDSVDT